MIANAEVGEAFVARSREVETPRDVFTIVGPLDDVEQQLEVERAAGKRTLHAHHDGGVRTVRKRERTDARDRRL